MKAVQILVALAAVWAGTTSAQTLTDVKVSAAQVRVGEAVQATANLEVTQGTNCGLRINWGDGTSTDNKINQAQDVPMPSLALTPSWRNPSAWDRCSSAGAKTKAPRWP
jgi:hypothetical protein